MCRSYTYVGKYSAPNEHFGIYGASEREERIAHFSEKEKYEVCKLKPRIWCKGYYVDTAGKNTKAIKEYIANQLKQDSVIAF